MLERYFGYKPPISEDLQRKYESALHGVLRWKNGNWADYIYETDLDHVAGMFFILSEIKQSCLDLSSDIDIATVEHMIYIHDAGEVIVGDLTYGRDDYTRIHDKWKNKERAAFRLLTQQIEDEELKRESRRLYQRYILKRKDDKEALLTDFIDKDQGARFGFRNVFHGRGMNMETRQIHFNRSVKLITSPIRPLLQLVSQDTQTGLKNFLAGELERFSQYDYRLEATLYIKKLNAILQ